MPRIPISLLLGLTYLACLSSCASTGPAEEHPADVFLARLAELEGQSFAGRIVANEPLLPEDPFTGQALVVRVARVAPERVEMPFEVGEDRSRTFVLTRTEGGLHLAHDHRHPDGTEDELSQYGGETAVPGTPERLEFPVDSFSQALFSRTGRAVSNTNVWAMELEPGRAFVYELARPGRLFRVEFDLTRPLTP